MEGELRQVMIKNNLLGPALLIVALAAFLTFLTGVHIVQAMAIHTIGWRLVIEQASLMAGTTSKILMLALQFKTGILVMIKADFLPLFLCVTLTTTFAILPVVRIILLVAGITNRLGFILENISLMTVLA